jgi:uncharacterized protein (TIGR02996 family)
MSPTTITDADKAFLRAILDVPEDRNTWLIYADWLDDRGDPRAEFLRLMVARALAADDDAARAPVEERLAHLRTALDPHWLMVFDPAPVGNCPPNGWAPGRCRWRWDDMAATDVPDIRICRDCRRAVHYCHTIEEARLFVSCGQRVALSTRVPADRAGRESGFAPPPSEGTDEETLDMHPPEPFAEPPLPWGAREEFLDAEPPGPPPRPAPVAPARPWWKFW